MRIRVLCHRFPYPPNKGDRIRSFNIIRHLAQRHRLHLLSFLDRPVSDQEWQEINRLCEKAEGFPLDRLRRAGRCLHGLWSGRPLTHCYFDSANLRRRIEFLDKQKEVDLVLAIGTAMAPFAELTKGVPRILDIVDVDSAKWSQYAQRSHFPKRSVFEVEANRLELYEASLSQSFRHVIGTTRREIDLIRRIDSDVQASVVKNGVDLAAFDSPGSQKSDFPSLLFVGQMDYFANVDAVVTFSRRVFPALKRVCPDLEFNIVGRCPTPDVRRLERIEGIRVSGEVIDIQPHLSRAWVFLAPLRIAQGVQNKVLEAMAASVPVVVSEAVMEGLRDGGFEEPRDVRVAKSIDDMEQAVLALLSSRELRISMAEHARSKLEKAYQWSSNLRALDDVIAQFEETRADGDSAGVGSAEQFA